MAVGQPFLTSRFSRPATLCEEYFWLIWLEVPGLKEKGLDAVRSGPAPHMLSRCARQLNDDYLLNRTTMAPIRSPFLKSFFGLVGWAL